MNKGADYWKNQMEITRGTKHTTEETRTGCLAYEETNLRAALTASIPLDRLEALCAAEREGRCAVLPCKVGDTVFEIPKYGKFSGKIMERQIERFEVWRNNLYMLWGRTVGEWVSQIGDTVFLTRTEAEAALRERGGENDG
jgi:hypothetical protein